MENGTVWSNSSESSDDSSSPALAHHAQRLTASNMLQTTLTTQLSFTPHKSSASTPSLSSNQEEDETEAGEVFTQADAVPNGHPQTSCSNSHIGESSPDCTVTDRASLQSADLSETSADLSCSCPDVSSVPSVSLTETPDLAKSSVPQVCISTEEVKDDASEHSSVQAGQTVAEDSTTETGEGHQVEETHQPIHEAKQAEDALTVSSCTRFCVSAKFAVSNVTFKHLHLFSPKVPFPTSSSFNQEVETALESFDFLNCSDLEDEEEKENEQQWEDGGEKEEEEEDGQHEENQNKMEEEKVEEEEKDEENFYSGGRSVWWFLCQNCDELIGHR